MDYYLSFEDLERIAAARSEREALGEVACERDDCGEPAEAVILHRGPRFLCIRHAEREADELAARDLDDAYRSFLSVQGETG